MARSERGSFRRTRSPSRRGRLVVACSALAIVPALLACNSIIGLSDFEKGECPGARCGDGGAFPDQFVEGGADVQTDALPDVRGADPVSWAKWPMPHYGEGGAGQPLTSPPLVAAGDLVTDTVTKLVWRNALVPGDFKASDADGECKKLPNGPWRAPKRIELVTLLSFERAKPFIDTTSFTGFFTFKVWTTSEVRPFVPNKPDQAYWVVNFDTGAVEPLAGDQPAKVLCVRDK